MYLSESIYCLSPLSPVSTTWLIYHFLNELATRLRLSSAFLCLLRLPGSVLSCLPPVSVKPSQYADGAALIGKALDGHR